MEIVAAEVGDHELLTQLTKKSKAYWGFTKETLLKWDDLLTISKEYIEKNNVVKLLDNGEIIGYYSFFKTEENVLKLDNLFILPEYIGTGLGKILMNNFLDHAKNQGVEKISLDAEPKAEEFYAKFGFITVGKLETLIKDRYLPIMELKLK